MQRTLGWLFALVVLLGAAGAAQAGFIDFESGFVDQQALGAVNTGDNVVTFSVGSLGGGDAYVAVVGRPTTAFVPFDTPEDTGKSGEFFLTDEIDGPTIALDYFMAFANPISSLFLHLYDFRGDGGAPVGSTVTLTLYDAANAVVGTDSFTSVAGMPEGAIVGLSAAAGSPAVWAALTFSEGDVGTGIDNLRFETVPEPSTVLLLGVGLAGAGLLVRRKRR
jgi:hypothetical protein